MVILAARNVNISVWALNEGSLQITLNHRGPRFEPWYSDMQVSGVLAEFERFELIPSCGQPRDMCPGVEPIEALLIMIWFQVRGLRG